jgi:hypothetical protein
LRLLSELEGRVEDILSLADGRFVHPRMVWTELKDAPGILQYQLIQHESRRFELILATADGAAFERALAAARPGLQRLLGEDARIEASRRDEIARPAGGKLRPVLSLSRTAPRA